MIRNLLTAVIAFPVSATLLAGDTTNQAQQSLDLLRQQCIAKRQDKQIKQFDIKVLCRGAHTVVEKETQKILLPNNKDMSLNVTVKGMNVVEQVARQQLPADQATCEIANVYELAGPEGGIPVSISHCDDLNEDYIRGVCKDKLADACEGNTADVDQKGNSQVDSFEQATMCTKTLVKTISSCDSYKVSQTAQQTPAQG